jgi:hypothetical protein
MIPCFKLKNLELKPPIKQQLIVNYGKVVNNKFMGISYYHIDETTQKNIMNEFIPKNYQHFFEVTWMEITSPYIPPHTDSKVNCVINIYLDTNDAVTTFYKVNKECNTIKIANQTDGSIFDENSLEKIYQFKAKPNEVWILDIKQPHSVYSENSNIDNVRTAYCVQSKVLNYESVKSILL